MIPKRYPPKRPAKRRIAQSIALLRPVPTQLPMVAKNAEEKPS